MLILAHFFQVDKCNAQFSFIYFLLAFFGILLHFQVETETGSAGEHPVRDTFG
jgi:hypothetical protein